MIKRLQKNHELLWTSRNYREVTELAKMRHLDLLLVGKFGGAEKYGKLNAGLERMIKLSKIINKFSPDLTISSCSPDASRISHGLGIKHVGFCNSPHSKAVMKLSVPLLHKLLTPWFIPKKEFEKFGISKHDIIHYKALDEYVIIKGTSSPTGLKKFPLKFNKTILFRTYESQASYLKKNIQMIPTIMEIAKTFSNFNIIVLGRYLAQIKNLKDKLGKRILVLNQVVDSKEILEMTDIFIGSGGTMTQEAALRGIATISYNAVPNLDEKFLVRKGLVKRGETPKRIIKLVKSWLNSDQKEIQKKANKLVNSMEDPFTTLKDVINSIKE